MASCRRRRDLHPLTRFPTTIIQAVIGSARLPAGAFAGDRLDQLHVRIDADEKPNAVDEHVAAAALGYVEGAAAGDEVIGQRADTAASDRGPNDVGFGHLHLLIPSRLNCPLVAISAHIAHTVSSVRGVSERDDQEISENLSP